MMLFIKNNKMNTKLLDKKFTKKGEVFTQVEKGETYYIYKRKSNSRYKS